LVENVGGGRRRVYCSDAHRIKHWRTKVAEEVKGLSGEAREAFDRWVRIGFSEVSALEQLRRDGLIVESGFDRAVGMFVSMGLSVSAAREATVGRVSESEARRQWDTAVAKPAGTDAARRARIDAALSKATPAELAELQEALARRRSKTAKAKPAAKAVRPSFGKNTVVSEDRLYPAEWYKP
jgi:hypothetical protein